MYIHVSTQRKMSQKLLFSPIMCHTITKNTHHITLSLYCTQSNNSIKKYINNKTKLNK